MDVREKLVELLKTNACPAPFMCDPACRYYGYGDCFPDRYADHLISNGVTVQEWIPLSKQKPNRDDLVIVFFDGMRDTSAAIQIMYGWCIGGSASHWMPLPDQPKGE